MAESIGAESIQDIKTPNGYDNSAFINIPSDSTYNEGPIPCESFPTVHELCETVVVPVEEDQAHQTR